MTTKRSAHIKGAVPSVLTIAGSDCSGGAGIQADLKTFTALRVYGASVITALTAQNTVGVQGVQSVSTDFIRLQMESVFDDNEGLEVVKIGMLGNVQTIRVVGAVLREQAARRKTFHIVLDPVLVATSGDQLITDSEREIIKTMVEELFPLATVVTPNIPEALKICEVYGCGVDFDEGETEAARVDKMKQLAFNMVERMRCKCALVKGGHSTGSEETCCDILYDSSGQYEAFVKAWIDTRNTHGTGCTLASAIAACVAWQGGRGGAGEVDLKRAIWEAKEFVWVGLELGKELDIGSGHGPLFHMHTVGESWNGARSGGGSR